MFGWSWNSFPGLSNFIASYYSTFTVLSYLFWVEATVSFTPHNGESNKELVNVLSCFRNGKRHFFLYDWISFWHVI
jgi:hypothetical protein